MTERGFSGGSQPDGPAPRGLLRGLPALLAAALALTLLAACNHGEDEDPGPTTVLVCTGGQIPQGGDCVNPPPDPVTCTAPQVLVNGVCTTPTTPPTPVTCSTSQILLGNSCQSLALTKTLGDAATSLTFWNARVDYQAQNRGLTAIKAHYAYSSTADGGYDGSGITVGVVDDGVQHHRVFQDASGSVADRLSRVTEATFYSNGFFSDLDSTALNVATTPDPDGPTNCLSSSCPIDHGTAVASVISAQLADTSSLTANNSLRGVAPSTRVVDLPYTRFQEKYCTPPDRCQGGTPNIASTYGLMGALFRAATAQTPKPRYINVSQGIQDYLPDAHVDAGLRFTIQQRYRLVAWPIWTEARDSTNGSVFVFSAGNDPDRGTVGKCLDARSCTKADQPLVLGALPAVVLDELAPLGVSDPNNLFNTDISSAVLTVVAVEVGSDGTPGALWSGSNKCGRAKDWCLAAPGVNIRIAHGTTRYDNATGTSFAAPLVTGAMALIDQAFTGATGASSVSPQAVRRRILDTANSEGTYADEDTYGQGLLDIQAAFTPQGLTTVVISPSPPREGAVPGAVVGSAQGPGALAAGLGFALPASVRQALASTRLMVLDGHGFPFHLPMQAFVHTPHMDAAAPAVSAAARNAAPIYAGRLGFSASGLGEDGNASWSSALAPEHQLAGGWLAAGAHLHVSPLVAAGLNGGNAQHLALRLRLADSVVSAMTCERLHTGQALHEEANSTAGSCMALGWDWAGSDAWGLSLRAHRMDSRTGLYGYGMRCLAGACGQGGATATELGVGGFARVANGLRLGWNWWQGRASDQRGAVDLIRYQDMGHSAGSLALEDISGNWSLYLQQPLRATGTLALTLPHYRTPAGEVHFQRHAFDLDQGGHPLRLGFSGRVPLAARGGALALNLGAERGLHAAPGAHPYLHLETSIPW